MDRPVIDPRGSPLPPPPPPLQPSQTPSSDYPQPLRQERSRDRSFSPRRPSRYEERRYSRDDDRYGPSASASRGDDRGGYYRRDYYDRGGYRDEREYPRSDRYERGSGYYDRYDRYDDRRGYRSSPPPRPRHSRRPVDRGSAEDRKTSSTLFVGNLPYAYQERDVAAMFERYGRLVKVTVPMDVLTNKNKGFSFVEFEDRRDAEDAFDKFQGFSVEGRRLKLDWDIGLSKKDNYRAPRYGAPSGSRNEEAPLEDEPSRERSPHPPADPYAHPPPMESRGYRRSSPDVYRR
ncbi:hypothetical protein BDF14DRAFT_1936163 [Spinellus fusiger]|nr:hypothetical protein BDF14DRAFT_1936163 [Spinellus fusiger]